MYVTGAQQCREGKRNSPHHRLMRVENGDRRITAAARAVRLQHQGRRSLSTAQSVRTDTAARLQTHQRASSSICIAPRASRSPLTWACTSHIPLYRDEMHQHCHLSADQKGLYGRSEATVREVVARARHQASNLWRNVDRWRSVGIGPDHLSKSRGGGGRSAARPIIYLLPEFRGRFFPKYEGLVKIAAAWPAKLAALTQRWPSIALCVMAGCVGALDAQTHQQPSGGLQE